MRASWLGALHLVFALTALEDRIDAGTATNEDVLAAQVLTHVGRLLILRVVDERVGKILADSTLSVADELTATWQRTVGEADRCVAEPEHGAFYCRDVLDRLTELYACACLLEAAESRGAKHLLRTRMAPGDPDPGLEARVDELVTAPA